MSRACDPVPVASGHPNVGFLALGGRAPTWAGTAAASQKRPLCDVVRRRKSLRQVRLEKPSRVRRLSGRNGAKFNWLVAWQEFEIHFQPGPIQGPDDLEGEEPRLKQLFHLAMLARGPRVPPHSSSKGSRVMRSPYL